MDSSKGSSLATSRFVPTLGEGELARSLGRFRSPAVPGPLTATPANWTQQSENERSEHP